MKVKKYKVYEKKEHKVRNADVGLSPLCKHLECLQRDVFALQVNIKGRSKGKKFSCRSETTAWKHR